MQTLLSLDRNRLAGIASASRDVYEAAVPFPHVVLDDFLPPATLDGVLAEFPSPASAGWFRFDSDRERKLAAAGGELLGPITRHVFAQLNGSAMLDFLGQLTGIDGLVPDPHLFGGGLHQIERGGFLEVHADFNLHPVTRLYRRLNLLLYLNREWNPVWGGELELWNRTMSECEVSIVPLFNRCVILNTTDHSFHGHPEPLMCPAGVTRKSLALYYYAREPDPSDSTLNAHNTLFQPRPHGGIADATPSVGRRFAREVLPPIVLRGLRRLRDRRVR